MTPAPTTRILDNFNRADGPLGADWTAATDLSGGMPDVSGGHAIGGDGFKAAVWNTPFDAASEVYFTVPDVFTGGIYFGLYLRLNGGDGYQVFWDPLTFELVFSRLDAAVGTEIHREELPSISDGVGVHAKMTGAALTFSMNTGGSWVQIFQETDTNPGPHLDGGQIGWGVYDLGAGDLEINDFGGGNIGAAGVAPSNTSGPRLEGLAETDLEIVCDPGEWAGDATISFDYQWQREGTDIFGEETASYTLTEDDEGVELRCRVTGWNASGVAVAYSNELESIASTEGADDTLVRVGGVTLPVRMRVAVAGEWF